MAANKRWSKCLRCTHTVCFLLDWLQGNAFIALPDGNAIYYTFLGSAQEAKVVTVPSREWPCKKELNEEFTISNWLKTPQR